MKPATLMMPDDQMYSIRCLQAKKYRITVLIGLGIIPLSPSFFSLEKVVIRREAGGRKRLFLFKKIKKTFRKEGFQ